MNFANFLKNISWRLLLYNKAFIGKFQKNVAKKLHSKFRKIRCKIHAYICKSIKKRLRHSCFPLNYADISSRPFCITVVSIHSPHSADFFIYTRLVQKLTEENG